MFAKQKLYGTIRSNRIAYFLTYGEDPEELQVCHHCDNPPCCNGKHLFKGTNYDNQQDKIKKGRAKYHVGPQKNPHHNHAKGEHHGRSKLTESNVLEILHRCSEGGARSKLSNEFHVSKETIADIVSRRTWTHI
jgi:hypothetical protein